MKIIENAYGVVVAVFNGGACLAETKFGKTYIPSHLMTRSQLEVLEKGSEVVLFCKLNNAPGARSPYLATEVISVAAPQQPATAYGVVKWYNPQIKMGFVAMIGEHPFKRNDAIIYERVLVDADVNDLEAGNKVFVLVENALKGPVVKALRIGRHVSSEVDRLLAQVSAVDVESPAPAEVMAVVVEAAEPVASAPAEVTPVVVVVKAKPAKAPTKKVTKPKEAAAPKPVKAPVKKSAAKKPMAKSDVSASDVAEAPTDIVEMAKVACLKIDPGNIFGQALATATVQ